jgi:formate hydrogenlyase subunit 6/NADH:ubiquinone oxidoreductase subunit I
MGRLGGTTPPAGILSDQTARDLARRLGSIARGIVGSGNPGPDAPAPTPQPAHKAGDEQRDARKTAAVIDRERCTGCGVCVGLCPKDAIRIDDIVATVDVARCTGCGECIEICPNDAISL